MDGEVFLDVDLLAEESGQIEDNLLPSADDYFQIYQLLSSEDDVITCKEDRCILAWFLCDHVFDCVGTNLAHKTLIEKYKGTCSILPLELVARFRENLGIDLHQWYEEYQVKAVGAEAESKSSMTNVSKKKRNPYGCPLCKAPRKRKHLCMPTRLQVIDHIEKLVLKLEKRVIKKQSQMTSKNMCNKCGKKELYHICRLDPFGAIAWKIHEERAGYPIDDLQFYIRKLVSLSLKFHDKDDQLLLNGHKDMHFPRIPDASLKELMRRAEQEDKTD